MVILVLHISDRYSHEHMRDGNALRVFIAWFTDRLLLVAGSLHWVCTYIVSSNFAERTLYEPDLLSLAGPLVVLAFTRAMKLAKLTSSSRDPPICPLLPIVSSPLRVPMFVCCESKPRQLLLPHRIRIGSTYLVSGL